MWQLEILSNQKRSLQRKACKCCPSPQLYLVLRSAAPLFSLPQIIPLGLSATSNIHCFHQIWNFLALFHNLLWFFLILSLLALGWNNFLCFLNNNKHTLQRAKAAPTWDVLVYSSYNLSYSLLFSWYWAWYSWSFLPTASMLSSFTNWSCTYKEPLSLQAKQLFLKSIHLSSYAHLHFTDISIMIYNPVSIEHCI